MPTPIQSVIVAFELSADNGITWKTVVCTASFTVNVQTTSSTTDTQCGRIIGLGPTAASPTVQAVDELYPNNSQVSYQQCLLWQNANTLLKFRVQSPSSGSVGFGIYITSQCYITDTVLTDTTNDPVKFSVTLLGLGNINTTVGT